jgi:glycosyltransferase involved in cell wall biosynthesis
MGTVVWARGLAEIARRVHADVIVVIGAAKLFPYPLLNAENAHKTIVLFGDNSDYYLWNSLSNSVRSLRTMLLRMLVKRWAYIRALKYSSSVVLYTPETRKQLIRIAGRTRISSAEEKLRFLPLGYDEEVFFFDEAKRQELRKHFNVEAQDLLFVTATRVVEGKGLEVMMEEVMTADEKNKYVIVGSQSDAYEGVLRSLIKDLAASERIFLLPFADKQDLRALYSAADIGLWSNPAISIQEALGTGLYIVLPQKKSIEHLLSSDLTGGYVEDGHWDVGLQKAMEKLRPEMRSDDIRLRRDRERTNRERLSYAVIAGQLITDYQEGG